MAYKECCVSGHFYEDRIQMTFLFIKYLIIPPGKGHLYVVKTENWSGKNGFTLEYN